MRLHFSRIVISVSNVLIALFFLADPAFCQLSPISLEQRVNKSDIIFEGRVTAKTSYWDQAHNQIYTSNVVTVYKVFKGNLISSEVEIITRGGTVGKNMEQVSHSLQLSVGDVGIFTAIPNTVILSKTSNLTRFKTYSGIQGFIKYDLINHTASDPFTTYKSISGDVYISITHITKSRIRTIKKADFSIQ